MAVGLRRGALALVAALALAQGAAAKSPPGAVTNGYGLQIASQRMLDSRLDALTVRTSALPKPANIRVLLPTGYAAHPHRRYPVLYLLHGTSGGAADWTTMGGAEQTTAGKQLIVVMPDIALNDDGGGWCTNWPDGVERWESFHIDQLIPWVDHNFRTVASRQGRAIAGLSQGGFCSMSYAARHPDLFSIALAYSGAPDIYYDPVARAGAVSIINATEVGLDGVQPDTFFGSPVTNAINWAAHDPTSLAGNLRWTKLFMYFGNGQPGPYDTNPVNPGAEGIESLIYPDNIFFHDRLDALGIPSTYDYYGNGTHSWPYWARDLRWSIGPIMADFAHPVPTPTVFNYTSAEYQYSVYGWQVNMHRLVREFSSLENAGLGGFALAGSGSATVTTPPAYNHGALYMVKIRSGTGTTTTALRASSGGQLVLQVPLGPSDTVQEYPLGGPPMGTTVYTTHVTITRSS